ncbi:sugar ABC transporter substrate-binding protein [Brachyspira alvinipulli]|uniref:sugar ABC transporter substrate-binding protein n=1 Tax=Brachyspira alvinipulli TaxID=84379 RepID=UPI0004AFA04D|nr:sugar ABC transporter substrate-binding protein [Brachyspira alvinipulli]
MNTTFVEALINDIEKYAKENYKNLTIIEKSTSEDSVMQQSQIESLITQEVDAIILQVANSGIASSIDSYAKENNTPLLYFNVRPNTLKEGSYSYVGMDERSVAFLQIEEVLKVRSNGNAVILSGNYNNEAVKLRTEGIFDNIKNTQIKILAQESGNWYENNAESIVDKWINLGLDINIVFSNNDDMAVGAIRALEKAGKKFGTNEGEIMVLGVDATPNGIQSIKEGKMYATIKQDTKEEAKMIIDSIVDMIKNNGKNRTVLISPEVIININNIKTEDKYEKNYSIFIGIYDVNNFMLWRY